MIRWVIAAEHPRRSTLIWEYGSRIRMFFSHVTADAHATSWCSHVLARARSFAGQEVWNVRWVLNVLLSLLEMILRGLCKTIYQGLRGLCIYGSNSRSSAQIVLRETPTVLSKRPRSLSMQRNVAKNYGVFSFKTPVNTVRARSKQLSHCIRRPLSQLTRCGRKTKQLRHWSRWPSTRCGLKAKQLSHYARSPLSEQPSDGIQRTKPCIIVLPIQNL